MRSRNPPCFSDLSERDSPLVPFSSAEAPVGPELRVFARLDAAENATLDSVAERGDSNPPVQPLTVQRFGNCLLRHDANKPNHLRVALPHQSSRHVILFGSFRTLLETLNLKERTE